VVEEVVGEGDAGPGAAEDDEGLFGGLGGGHFGGSC
jgi:hypothetical protein